MEKDAVQLLMKEWILLVGSIPDKHRLGRLTVPHRDKEDAVFVLCWKLGEGEDIAVLRDVGSRS